MCSSFETSAKHTGIGHYLGKGEFPRSADIDKIAVKEAFLNSPHGYTLKIINIFGNTIGHISKKETDALVCHVIAGDIRVEVIASAFPVAL